MPETIAVLSRLLVVVALLYVVLAIAGHFWSLSLIFPRPPSAYQMGSDYLALTAADGTKLAARHWPNPEAKYTILYLHGNYEELGSIGEYLPDFVKAGYAVFAFDYRRYGRSEGTPSEHNLYSDTQLAYDYLRKELGVPPDRIVVFGYSLGGGPGVELAQRNPVAGIVLQGAFVSAYRVMTRIPFFVGDKFVNLSKIGKLTCPVMIIHGTHDGTVPFWHGEALYAAAPNPKTKFFVDGGRHAGLAAFAGPRYWEELKRFTDSL